MKKSALYSLMGSMMAISAGAGYAEDISAPTSTPTPLATTNYVDDGLRAVYKQEIKPLKERVGNSETGLVKEVADLQETVNDPDTGLTKDVADLKTAVQTLESADNTVKAGTGITVDADNKVSVAGLDDTMVGENMDKAYVYIGGVLTSIDTATNWGE